VEVNYRGHDLLRVEVHGAEVRRTANLFLSIATESLSRSSQKVFAGLFGRLTFSCLFEKLKINPLSAAKIMPEDKITRIAIVDSNRCKPKRCAQECKKVRSLITPA
jgi:hypothetical protein